MSNSNSQRSIRSKKYTQSIESKVESINKLKEFLIEVEYLQNTPLKMKGIEQKILEELDIQSWKIQEFLPYFPTFQLKFAERCQKKWSKKDKSMLLWIVIRHLQHHGKKFLNDLSSFDYEKLSSVLGIQKKTLIQEICQILSLKTSKNPFSSEEKELLTQLVNQYKGKAIKWNQVAQDFNSAQSKLCTLRNIKSLKQVYNNHLNPLLNKKGWEIDEDIKLIEIITKIGKKWQTASNIIKYRNQCQVKNEYYKLLREQMQLKRIPTSKKLEFAQEIELLQALKNSLIQQYPSFANMNIDIDSYLKGKQLKRVNSDENIGDEHETESNGHYNNQYPSQQSYDNSTFHHSEQNQQQNNQIYNENEDEFNLSSEYLNNNSIHVKQEEEFSQQIQEQQIQQEQVQVKQEEPQYEDEIYEENIRQYQLCLNQQEQENQQLQQQQNYLQNNNYDNYYVQEQLPIQYNQQFQNNYPQQINDNNNFNNMIQQFQQQNNIICQEYEKQDIEFIASPQLNPVNNNQNLFQMDNYCQDFFLQ